VTHLDIKIYYASYQEPDIVPSNLLKFIAIFPLCPIEKSALILTHFRIVYISSSLLSLIPELVYRVIKDLPIKDTLNFLLSYR